jgi:hypothetical protein
MGANTKAVLYRKKRDKTMRDNYGERAEKREKRAGNQVIRD